MGRSQSICATDIQLPEADSGKKFLSHFISDHVIVPELNFAAEMGVQTREINHYVLCADTSDTDFL
jgi:hypothetical protein